MTNIFQQNLVSPQVDYWQHQGVECAVHFHPGTSTLLGYCLIPDGHPLEQSPDWDEPWNLLDVHGGVTYGPAVVAGGCIVGFNTNHSGDYSYMTGTGRRWLTEDVVAETNRMATQIAETREGEAA